MLFKVKSNTYMSLFELRTRWHVNKELDLSFVLKKKESKVDTNTI